MRISRVLLMMVGLLLSGSASRAQFVTLQGRQFQLDGEPFYPLVMNFSVLYARDSSIVGTIPPDSIFFASDASHGPTATFDCTGGPDCADRLLLDLQKVRSMGFNAVRLTGGVTAAYRHAPDLGAEERRYGMHVLQHPFRLTDDLIPNHDHGKRTVDLEEELDGPYTQRQFELLEQILDVAAEADLKVILLVAGPTGRDSLAGQNFMYQAFDQQAVDDYARYLAKLGDALEGHPALLAYDVFNEPHYNKMEFQGWDGYWPHNEPKWTKEDICGFTQQWYDTLHVHDTTHLVTLGGLGREELEVWDMGALHLDFYSLHLYPLRDYKDDWEVNDAIARFAAETHWFSRVCPLPWIIGETGFAANDRADSVYLPHVGVDPEYHTWPYMHGTEAQQAAFADTTLKMVRAWGGAGWSWWMFQEWRWWHVYYEHPYLEADKQFGAFYGMLHLGDANADWYDKPAVDVVEEYAPGPVPPAVEALPPNYYNWSNLDEPVSFSGTILDQDDVPIQDAMAWMRFRSEDNPAVSPDLEDYESFHVATSDQGGDFSFLTEPTTEGYFSPLPRNLILVAVGTNAPIIGEWTSTPLISNTTHSLYRHPFHTAQSVEDLQLYSHTGDPDERFAGGVELQVRDVDVYGIPHAGARTVHFTASRTVHITGEFHADIGSETHVFLEAIFPGCADTSYRSLPVISTDLTLLPQRLMATVQRIQLQFLKEDSELRVYPNPFDDQVTLDWNGVLPAQLELMNGLGATVGRWNLQSSRLSLHLDQLADGPYRLHIHTIEGSCSELLIKQAVR